MGPMFRRIAKATVMCTVQGCDNVATFMFTGSSGRGSGSRPAVGAFCHPHAKETAARIGHPWPLPEPSREYRVVRSHAMRAS